MAAPHPLSVLDNKEFRGPIAALPRNRCQQTHSLYKTKGHESETGKSLHESSSLEKWHHQSSFEPLARTQLEQYTLGMRLQQCLGCKHPNDV